MAENTGNGAGDLPGNESVDADEHRGLATALVQVDVPRSERPLRADPRFLSVRQVARVLGVCPHSVYALCETGRLRCVRVLNTIRIGRADLEMFLNVRRQPV